MKIAILDADPRICGPMTWMRHLAVGFTQLGHEVSVVSSTKSGRARSGWGTAKWGTHWSVFVPEVVKDEALTARLDAADLVILPEPKVPALDKEALKAGTAPVYVDTLQRTKTPFIFALHGNDYDEKSAPFMKDLMVEEWCGTIISHSARSVASNPVIPLSPVIEQPLPYVPRLGTQEAREYTNTVGTTGRFIFNKGPHLVALAAVELSTPATVELWGSASVGLGTNHTFDVYEKLLPKASQYKRYGDQDEKVGQPGWTEHGNTIRPFLWDVRTQNGALVRYLGNYTDPVAVSTRLAVHVNLTGIKFSGGLVEYSTLEAMDAGCVCITTPQTSKPDVFTTLQFPLENPPGSATTAVNKHTELITELARYLDRTIDFTLNQLERRDELVRFNRENIRSYNNPRRVAQAFIDGAFS